MKCSSYLFGCQATVCCLKREFGIDCFVLEACRHSTVQQALASGRKMQNICCQISLQIRIFVLAQTVKVMAVAVVSDFETFGIDLHATN